MQIYKSRGPALFVGYIRYIFNGAVLNMLDFSDNAKEFRQWLEWRAPGYKERRAVNYDEIGARHKNGLR